ncbi:MAG TPA: ATP-binding protein [Pyrinomonadaceae bacterium]|nr:ATP-binding protein [Pyrinomonadaceae bacterium]
MEKASEKQKRRKTPWVVGLLMVASLAVLVILQSTSLWKEFAIQSSSDLLLLYALSSLNFIAFIIFAFIFGRSIVKLVRERRTFELGAKIKTRLLIYFFAVSLLPIIAMAVFSFLFMNRALERWFTQIPGNVIREAREVQEQSLVDRSARLGESAKMIASVIGDREPTGADLARIAAAGGLAHISIVSRDLSTGAIFDRDVSAEERAEIDRLVASARSGNTVGPTRRDGKGFDVAAAEMTNGRRLIVVPDPFGSRTVSQIVENSLSEFERLKQEELIVRQVGLLTLGVLTFLLIFASSWIAFYVARGLTTPIKALAEGADEIARGNFGHRVDVLAEDELALLVSTFNSMSANLESNSIELTARRRYIEAVLETLPTGVISFDADDRVSTINPAAVSILRVETDRLIGSGLDGIVGDESRANFQRLLARARRVGHASDQTMITRGAGNRQPYAAGEVTVALTATKLPADAGVVLVIEDLSELIAAQRASAWQEVAQRMAHEIKNPLTPIQLSAERIAKRFSAGATGDNCVPGQAVTSAPLTKVVNESTATILREVTSLKSMVDEFSRFARLPDTKLAACDINHVVRQAAAVFDGRLNSIRLELELGDNLPEVLLDYEQLKRVYVNLIENSIEALGGEMDEPRICVTTRYDMARDMVISEISDNGKGIAQSDMQKLFQPYFSTKGRGTGLGLAIVNRIVAEHRGRINAVLTQPYGAKFIIELPVAS